MLVPKLPAGRTVTGRGSSPVLRGVSVRHQDGGTSPPAERRLARRTVRRLSEVAGLHWHALSRLGRISLTGVAASAVVAVALGIVIPQLVRGEALEARLQAVGSLVRVLEDQGLVPDVDDHLTGRVYRDFDEVVDGGLLGGENVRVKLWNRTGEIVYSDQEQIVGSRFPIGHDLGSALSGHPTAEISDTSAPENRFERAIGDKVLEFYVPLHGDDGEVVGAFEVYQRVEPFTSHLGDIRRVVWLAVGSGLSILLVFLVSLFSGTAAAMSRDKQRAEERAQQLATMLETAKILGEEPLLRAAGGRVLERITQQLGLGCSSIVIDDGQGTEVVQHPHDESRVCSLCSHAGKEAARTQRHIVRTLPADARLPESGSESACTAIALPFATSDLRGALAGCRDSGRAFSEVEIQLLTGIATQIGVAAESSKLFDDVLRSTEQRRRLLRRLVTAQEEERRHLVGELHDGLGQKLTRILYGLRGASQRLTERDGEVAAELAHLEQLVDEESSGLRRYMAEIKPAQLDESGLASAIESFAREQEGESGLVIDVGAQPLPQLSPPVGIAIYRAVQETVMNVRKHAQASRVAIELRCTDHTLLLEVSDDGHGSSELRDGTGLSYMRDRIASLEGSVDIDSTPGVGTTVRIQVLLEDDSG